MWTSLDPSHPPQGFTHLLTRASWTGSPGGREAIPIADTTTQGVAKTLIASWVSRFGTPPRVAIIVSDRGTAQFVSQLWTEHRPALGRRAAADNRLPSPVQWDGRAVSPPTKGIAHRQAHRTELGKSAPVGPAWDPRRPQTPTRCTRSSRTIRTPQRYVSNVWGGDVGGQFLHEKHSSRLAS